jgi:hypothetical protein
MQLNVYVPARRAGLLEELDRLVADSGRAKNEIVLDAIQEYLERAMAGAPRREFRVYDLGEGQMPSRAKLYEAHLALKGQE